MKVVCAYPGCKRRGKYHKGVPLCQGHAIVVRDAERAGHPIELNKSSSDSK